MQVLNPSISINQISYVIALEKTGSFSEAAKICSVTQGTFSTMIKKLEEQLNMPLFDRKTKPIRLTKEGGLLISQFKVINNEYENLIDMVAEANNEYFGSLKIGIIPTLAPFLLPLILPKLLKEHPQEEFEIYETTTHEIVQRLKLRELDVGVISLPLNNDEFIETSLFTEDFFVYDTRRYTNRKSKYKITDIDVSRLWLLEESHCLSSQIGKICHLKKKQKSPSKLAFNSGSILSLLELVNINQGITLLPRLATLQKQIVNPKYLYPLQNPVPVRDVGIITYRSFRKKRLSTLLQKQILKAVKPLLKKNRNFTVIDPF